MTRILLVEDDPWFGELYAGLLARKGWTVDWRRDAYDAMEAIDQAATLPTMIVLDLMLPWANGVQFLGELASHVDLSRIPVVLCSSALPRDTPAETLAAYGVVRVIDKTASSPKRFVAAITEALTAQNISPQPKHKLPAKTERA